jgi:hypothetical protein
MRGTGVSSSRFMRSGLRRITALAGEEATLTLVCDASDLPLACGPSGVSEMKPTVAPVTQIVPAALAAASIGLSLFVLPGGGESLRPLPVVPAVNLVTGRIAASLEAPGHAAAASSRLSVPTAPAVSTSAGGARHAAGPAGPRVRRLVPRRSVAPPPVSSPRSTLAAPHAPAPRATGRGKAKLQVQAHSPPGLSRSAGRGHARGHNRAQGAPQGPPAERPGSKRDGNGGDHDNHGSEQHRGGGP